MKFNKWTLGLAAVASLALFTHSIQAQSTYRAVQGIYIDGTTNTTVNAGGVASPANVILPLTTNYFNLSTQSGTQASTNLWPALCVTGSRGQPARSFTLAEDFACGAANAGIITYRYAPSTDGSHWLTNSLINVTITANGTSHVNGYTNWDSGGFPFIDLYSEENTNATVFATNNVILPVGKNQ